MSALPLWKSCCPVSGRKVAFFVKRLVQFNELLWEAFIINGFTQLSKLIIEHALLVTPNTEHYRDVMFIRLYRCA